MKLSGLHVLFSVMAGSLAAEEVTAPSPAKTSPRLRQEIRATLPKFDPPAPVAPEPRPEVPVDPNVFVLPKFTVKEKRPPSHDPDAWLTEKAVQQKAMSMYKQSLTDLEWALNSWYIPVIGTSPAARARDSYAHQKKMSELHRIHDLFKTIANVNPKAAVELEQARVQMEQAEHWQQRPAGDGRAK